MNLVKSMTVVVTFAAMVALPRGQAADVAVSVFTGGGNVSMSPGGCLQLTSALGQPFQNTTFGGKYQIQTGFLAAVRTDAIFHAKFEVCS